MMGVFADFRSCQRGIESGRGCETLVLGGRVCSFVGESMKDDGTMVFAYYKEGKTDPTFLYFGDALKEVKC